MPYHNQIIGVIRFSMPALTGWHISGSDPAKVRDVLYDSNRMAQRFALFERFCLPSLIAQTDQNFTTLVVVGECLPQAYRNRLDALLNALHDVKIAAVPPQPHYNAIKQAVAEVSGQGYSHRTTFRLDDDDMLGPAYIKKMRRYCFQMHKTTNDKRYAVAFNLGYYLNISDPAVPHLRVRRQTQPLGLGLSLTTRIKDDFNVFRWNHLETAARYTTFSNARDPMFVRTIHDHNDTIRAVDMPHTIPVPADKCDRIMMRDMGRSWADLTAPLGVDQPA